MAKFINKKEQVYDLKLTSYGRYLFSVGKFKPVYYAFFDDNVLYNKIYAHSSSAGASEDQSNVDNRIKNDTQYLESLVLFQDLNEIVNENVGDVTEWYNKNSMTSRMVSPAKDVFKFDSAIGDARLDGLPDHAPAWRVVALQSFITSSTTKDSVNDTLIPQINKSASYRKRVVEDTFKFDPQNMREMNNRTRTFIDDKVIELESRDPMYYIEELNTELLTNNFNIEVFHVQTNSSPTSGSKDRLQRKYFRKKIPQVQNGFLVSETKKDVYIEELGTGSIEYYFDVLLDNEVDSKLACRGASVFNKQSYYVDLDFDCEKEQDKSLFYDIYGTVTEPEICQD